MNLRCFSVLAGIGISSARVVVGDKRALREVPAAPHGGRTALQSHRVDS